MRCAAPAVWLRTLAVAMLVSLFVLPQHGITAAQPPGDGADPAPAADEAEVSSETEVPRQNDAEQNDAADAAAAGNTPRKGAAEDDAAEPADAPPSDTAAERRELPASFDALRSIYFFQGQASGLVPETFRAIGIDQLDARLRSDRRLSQSASDKPQLIRSVYVARLVDSSLVSTGSTWEISYPGNGPARLALGRLGFALQSSTLVTGASGPVSSQGIALIADTEGRVSVPVESDSKVTLAWTAAGRESDREVLFDLAVPKAAQSRWLIEVPQGMHVQALDGVGHALPSPPPEAASRDLGRGTLWFAIEAGGLTRLRLRILKVAPDSPQAVFTIRQAAMHYELTPASVRFSARMVVEPPADGVLPPIEVSDGRIISLSIDGSSAQWSETATSGGQVIRISNNRSDRPVAGPVNLSGPINLSIEGEAAWIDRPGTQRLPWLQFRESSPILVGGEVQAKLSIEPRLSLPRVELPPGWRYTSPPETDERRTTYRLSGPWTDQAPSLRAVPETKQLFADSVLRLSATESRLRAVMDISVSLASLGPQPIRMRVENGWTPEVVLLPQSGRAVDLANDVAARRNIVIWPTADELNSGNLIIRVVGSQPLSAEDDWARYPSTSFLSISNCRNRCAAVVTPPPGFRWTAEASLRTNRIAVDQLSAAQRQLLAEPPSESLLLDISHSRIAVLESRRPAAAFSVANLMRLTIENNRLVETHLVKCESASGDLNQIRIEFASGHRPDIEWSIQDKADPMRRLIRATRLTTMQAGSGRAAGDESALLVPESVEPREIWDLDLEKGDARSVVLIGRREYPIPPLPYQSSDPTSPRTSAAFRVDLPNVTGASSRLAQVWVAPALEVQRFGEGVLRVAQLVGGDLLENEPLAGPPGGTALRYESSGTTWIEVRAIDTTTPVAVLWQESVQITASGRGGDWISATYSVEPGASLAIDHDRRLRVASVTDQQGTPLEHDASLGRLAVKAMPTSTQVNIQWSRDAASRQLWQRWSPPRIAVSGVLLRRDWQLVSASDTLVPAALVAAIQRPLHPTLVASARSLGQPPADSSSTAPVDALSMRLDPDQPQSLWLVERSIGLSLVAVIGCVLFAVSWWLTDRSPIVVAIGFTVSVLLLMGLPQGWTYWVAGVCVPIAAGALISTSLRASLTVDRGPKSTLRSGDPASRPSQRSIELTQRLEDGSHPSSRPLLGKLGNWLLLSLWLPLSLSSSAIAQQTNEELSTATGARPTVLIPAKPDGSRSGDKVYISQNFFNELFRDRAATTASPVIASAVYRLRLDGMSESAMPTAEWEVRYAVAGLGERTELMLPIRAGIVRSVQWLPDGDLKPLRWSSENENQIRISLPPGPPAAELLLRLSSDVESPEKWIRRIQLSVPPVPVASLVVDSNSAVQRFELAAALGQSVSQPEAGRFSASLGTTSSIDLTVSLRQGARGIPAIAARRYWVHAGHQRSHVECEIEPTEEAIRRGGDAPIVILGGDPPILTSPDWMVHASEMISPRRQLLTLRALRDGPEPIRLLWEIPTNVSSGAEPSEEASTLTIPDVISAGSAQTPEAMIALHAAPGLQLAAQGPSLATTYASADAVDAFVASWKGYRGTAQQVIRSASPLAQLVVSAPPARGWKSAEKHHLHLRRGETRLTLDATITRGERPIGPLRLTLPPGSDIRELSINGIAVSSGPQRIGKRLELALPEPTGTDPIRLRVITNQRLPATDPFGPPRIRIEPIGEVTGSYSLTRNQAVRVEQVAATGLPEIETPPLDIADQLHNSWIPCWTWQIDETRQGQGETTEQPADLPGKFRIESQMPTLDVVQQTTLRMRQSRWMMDAVVRIQTRGSGGGDVPLLDDISVELPTTWSDQLTVEPAEAWSSQPAINPATKIVRIRPDAASREAGVATIRIQGWRVGELDTLLEVPRVQVIGAASRRNYLVVPKSSGGRSLVWKAVSAVADELPEPIRSAPGGSAEARRDEANLEVFRALNNAATVRLEPSRPETSIARATAADIQLFPQGRDRLLAIMRWDLEPGDRDRVAVNIPAGAEPLAVWTAGKPVLASRRQTSGDSSDSAASGQSAAASSAFTMDVALSLSRLAQPLVLLCQLQIDASGAQPELPQLVDIDVAETWMTVYRPGGEFQSATVARVNFDDDWSAAGPQDRLLLLARSVLQVTESSISGATDRPQEEVAAWLKSWDERLLKLKSEAERLVIGDDGRAPGDEDQTAGDEDRTTGDEGRPSVSAADGEQPEVDDTELGLATLDEESELAEMLSPWRPITRQWRLYTRRVTGSDASPAGEPSAAIIPAAHWQVAAVGRHPGAATRLPMLRMAEGRWSVAFAINLLTAGVILIGCALLTWRFRNGFTPLATHPAFWLFAVGAASSVIAPVPVALAICFVALTGALLSRGSGPAAQRDLPLRRPLTRS